MATYQDGNVRKATPNTVTAMKRSAESRRCPACGRKSALVAFDDGWSVGRVCRWDDCGWARLVTPDTDELDDAPDGEEPPTVGATGDAVTVGDVPAQPKELPMSPRAANAAELETLVVAARAAAGHAHAPYSNFHVGAAVMTVGGLVIPGCNIENASYGLTVCAERTAMFSAVAQGHATRLVALAVTCPDGDPTDVGSVMPCGACRQVMTELLVPDAVIAVDGVGTFSLDDLLPQAFTLKG